MKTLRTALVVVFAPLLVINGLHAGQAIPDATQKSAAAALEKNPKVNPFGAFDSSATTAKGRSRKISTLNDLTNKAIAAKQITLKKGNAQVPAAFAGTVNKTGQRTRI